MATQWAGDFSCGTCGQKRLTAAAFSKKQLEKRSKDLTASIKCKQCVDAAAEKERADASARAAKKAAEEVRSARTVPATRRQRTCRRALPAEELSSAERLIGNTARASGLRRSLSPNHTGDCDPRELRCASRRGRASEVVTSARGDGVR